MAAKTNSLVDLRSLEIVSDYNTHLMCLVCHCPYIRPIRLRCDHIFCQNCLNACIATSNTFVPSSQPKDFLCPTCRTPTNATFSTVPRLIITMCDDVLVKCPLHTEGCTEIVQRGHVQSHVDKYCDYRLVHCPDMTCDKKLRKKDLIFSEKCLHGSCDCEECGESMTELEFDTHAKQLCPRIKVECPDCDESVFRTELEEHIESCPKATQPCGASKFGCQVRQQKDEIEQHEKDCPLISLAPYLETQSSRIASMDSTIRQLKQQNEILEEGIAGIRSTLAHSTTRPSSRDQTLSSSDVGLDPVTPSTPEPQSESTPQADTPPETTSSTPSNNNNNTTTYLLSIHESLRDEVSQLSTAITDLDARASMSMMNENLRIREDMAHFTAGLNTVRMQVHMLMNSRLNQGQRGPVNPRPANGGNTVGSVDMSGQPAGQSRINIGPGSELPRSRRLSDDGWEGTKL